MKRVGINLLWLVPGVVGGSETYTVRLLKGLSERFSEIEYTLFALPTFERAHTDLARSFRTVYAPLSGTQKPARVVAGDNTWLALQSWKRKIDLIHHAGGIIPLLRLYRRAVLTIHDLQYLFYPEYFTRTKLRYLRSMVPHSAETARLIVTPSEFTRRTTIERLQVDASVVRVVPHGISPHLEAEPTSRIRDRYGLGGPFFFYPAATYPHKNHLVLIQAMKKVVKVERHAKLVLTGSKVATAWGAARSMEGAISAEISRLGLGDNVMRLGYVSGADLEALYREATAVVFPSRFEGFGAPILEAMARRCPVIAADVTAIPETVGDAGLLVPPDDPSEWYRMMREVMEDDMLREQLVKRGAERATRFTWKESADALEDAYNQVLATTL